MAVARTKMTVEGLSELNKALAELPKATSRNVLRRVGRKALEPMEQTAEALAPRLTGELQRTIDINTKLSRRQQAAHRRLEGAVTVKTAEGFRSTPKTTVFLFMGPGGGAKSIAQEFGTSAHAPQPYMRPAWDANKMRSLEIIRDDLAGEIDKAVKRLAKKTAKQQKQV